MKPLDILLIVLIIYAVILAFRRMHRRKKSGKCIGCGGDCSHCMYREPDKDTNKNNEH